MNSAEIIQDYESKIHSLESENNTLQKRCDQYAEAYDSLQHQLKELLRNRFGKKSERFIDPEHPQFHLLEENKNIFAMADAAGILIAEDETQVAAHSRKKYNKRITMPYRDCSA